MKKAGGKILIVGGGTSGAVLAARLREVPAFSVTLIEAGPDDDIYDSAILDPARAAEAWMGAAPIAPTPMMTETGAIPIFQGRLMGGTSAVNGLATLRGLPEDYDARELLALRAGVGTMLSTRSSLQSEMPISAMVLYTAARVRCPCAVGGGKSSVMLNAPSTMA